MSFSHLDLSRLCLDAHACQGRRWLRTPWGVICGYRRVISVTAARPGKRSRALLRMGIGAEAGRFKFAQPPYSAEDHKAIICFLKLLDPYARLAPFRPGGFRHVFRFFDTDYLLTRSNRHVAQVPTALLPIYVSQTPDAGRAWLIAPPARTPSPDHGAEDLF